MTQVNCEAFTCDFIDHGMWQTKEHEDKRQAAFSSTHRCRWWYSTSWHHALASTSWSSCSNHNQQEDIFKVLIDSENQWLWKRSILIWIYFLTKLAQKEDNIHLPQMKVEQVDQMDLKGVGGRQRDKSQEYSGESEALDQIAKEVRTVSYTHQTLPTNREV